MELEVIKFEKPQDINVIVGQSHFIKTVEDIYEILVSSVPAIQFGLAFNEASGKCL
ncbi:MAG: adenosine monophosphate-protein transferase, partial [Candidatus Omnitrophica bacterium]|nr:adenosine monophosphate-protein transferase [Candidatus Omnitrophota bacterium]